MKGETWRVDMADAKRLKGLEDENAKRKKRLSDQLLEATFFARLPDLGGFRRNHHRCQFPRYARQYASPPVAQPAPCAVTEAGRR